MTKYIAIFEVEDDCNIKTIDADVTYTYESNGTYYGMREGIEFEKEKTAAWVPVDAEPHDIYECNACGWLLYYEDTTDYKYCPNCGARMVSHRKARIRNDNR